MQYKLFRRWYTLAKTFHIKAQGQKLVPLEKECIPSDWTSDANIYMTDVRGGDISDRKRSLPNYNFG